MKTLGIFSSDLFSADNILQQWAQNLDSTSLIPSGALHGLPVSIKEYFGMKVNNISTVSLFFLV